MSDMEIFYGKFKKSDRDIKVGDNDVFYALEEELGCHFVNIDGDLYEFEPVKVEEISRHGFTLLIEPSAEPRFLCYWYNGGASLHEVAKEAIRSFLK